MARGIVRIALLGLAGTALFASGCSSDDDDDGGGSPDASGAQVDAGGGGGIDAQAGDQDVQLPDNWYPESLNAGSDGTVYVGSFASAQIAKFRPGDSVATVLVPAGTADPSNMAGVLVDDAAATILACTFDLTQGVGGAPSVIQRFSLESGERVASYPFQDNSLCNDMTFDDSGNIFIADSLGNIYILPRDAPDGSNPEVWLSDPLLAPVPPAVIGADGIAFDGEGALYVNTISQNRLLRIPIQQNGNPGEIEEITVTPSLNEPDGMRALDATTLVVAEAPAGRVSRIDVTDATATLTPLNEDLDQPSSVVRVGDALWVSEGQITRFITQEPPNTPFLVRRVPLEQ